MAALTPQSVVTTGTTPTPITPTVSTDTIAVATAGPAGWNLRVITTGTATNISISDPGFTASSNPGTVTAVAAPATGVRMIFIPKAAASPATGNVTITNTGALTGVTYELYTA